MLAQVKKIAGSNVAGRLGAWWSGRDYVPPVEGEAAVSEDTSATKADAPKLDVTQAPVTPEPARAEPPISIAPEPVMSPRAEPPLDGGEIRIRALETLWGEGRLSPGSFVLDAHMIDAALELADRAGAIGFIGADASLLNAFAAQSDRKPIANEWRAACVSRLNQLVANAVLTVSEVDRPRGFQDGALPAVVSVEAFAYSDHKAGLVGRVFRALDAGGRWVFVDTTRRTKKTPPQAFASAWAEPQLATNDEIEELLTLAGFKTIRRASVADLILSAARHGYANLTQVVESAAGSGLSGREGALFLQELAWEAQSWRARMRAIEGGALEMNLWVADRSEQRGPLKIALDRLIRPDDAGAADALFE